MLTRFALLVALAFAHVLFAQQVIPQLDKTKPPARPLKAPEREKIDPKDYPRYTAEKFTEGPAANWRKAVKPAVVEGDLKKMKNPQTNANWNGKHTLKYESIVDANKKAVGQGVSRATWNSTGKVYAEGNWRNDQYHGVWSFYTEQGVLEAIKCYKEGKLDGPYAEFKDGGLYRWGTCTGDLFNGEFRYFHKEGFLEYRVQWAVVEGVAQLEVQRRYNAKGELAHQWNYLKGKLHGDQLEWVEPWFDKDGKQGNPGTAGRLQLEHTDEEYTKHGWQTYYHQTLGYRLYDTWWEKGEQTGPFFINDAAGKQISGGTKTKGFSTGKWWEVDEKGNRVEYTNNDKGEMDGDYLQVDAKGKEIQKGRVKAGMKAGAWVHTYETYTETYTWAEDGTGLTGPYSKVGSDGKVQLKGSYTAGRRSGAWMESDLVMDIRTLPHYMPESDFSWLAEGGYEDDTREGKWVWKRENGAIACEGSYLLGARNGAWKFFHQDGTTVCAQGEYSFDTASGVWTFHNENGQKAAEGNVVGGQKDGAWVEYYDTGTKQNEGVYADGGQTGEWRWYHTNGKLHQRGTYAPGNGDMFNFGERIGEWDEFNEAGELIRKDYYEAKAPETWRGYMLREAPLEKVPEGVTIDPLLGNGTWATYQAQLMGTPVLVNRAVAVNGQAAGKFSQFWPNGKLGAEGLLYGETREGLWKVWYESGVQKEEGTFLAGVLEGPTRQWRTDGTLQSAGTFEQGKRKGLWTNYHLDGKTPQREATYGAAEQYDGPLTDTYANGQVQQKGNYAAGKQEGEWQGFHESGAKRFIVNYKQGNLEGRYRSWYANGKPEKEYTYLDGKYDGTYQKWHENGQLASKGTYKAGIMSGTWQDWYENGQLETETPFDAEGSVEGTYQRWHENGKLAAKGTFKADKKTGTWQEWHENGQLALEEQYDTDGNVTSAKAWDEDGTEQK